MNLRAIPTYCLILALLTCAAVFPVRAQDPAGDPGPYAVSVFGGKATGGTFGESLFTYKDVGHADTGIVAATFSERVYRFTPALSLEVEGGLGRRFGTDDLWEAWVAVGVRWEDFPWNDHLYTTVAIVTGPNLVSKPSAQERMDFDNDEQVLNYFAPEITFADPDHREREFFLRLHHRSGVFGLYSGADDAISFWSAGLRYRF